MDILKNRFLTLINNSGETDKALEENIGLPRGIIYKWKNDKNKNYKLYVVDMASYFHVSTDYLLGNTNDPRPAGDQKENPLPESQRILESVNSSENIDLLLHIIKNEASLSREQLLKLQGFVSALEAENK